MISFSFDWFDLLAVQGTLKSLLHRYISYMTTGKTTVLTIQTFVSKMMSPLFNMLSRFVIANIYILMHTSFKTMFNPNVYSSTIYTGQDVEAT